MALLARRSARSEPSRGRGGRRLLAAATTAVLAAALSCCGRGSAVAKPSVVPPTVGLHTTSLVAVTSRLAPGATGHALAHTASAARCHETVLAGGQPVTMPGLDPAQADLHGLVHVSWSVPPGATPGQYALDISCSPGGVTGTVFKVMPQPR